MSGALNLLGIGVPFGGGGGGAPAALAVSLNRTELSGFSTYKGTAVTAQSVTGTATGGVPPYTYSWALVSGDPDIVISSPTSETTNFRYFFASFGSSTSAVYELEVLDDVATLVTSGTVSVELSS